MAEGGVGAFAGGDAITRKNINLIDFVGLQVEGRQGRFQLHGKVNTMIAHGGIGLGQEEIGIEKVEAMFFYAAVGPFALGFYPGKGERTFGFEQRRRRGGSQCLADIAAVDRISSVAISVAGAGIYII